MQTEHDVERRIYLLELLKTEARLGENPFITFCRVRNRELNAPPGIMLPESAAAAMNDFMFLAFG
jgi:hypothetical protein